MVPLLAIVSDLSCGYPWGQKRYEWERTTLMQQARRHLSLLATALSADGWRVRRGTLPW
ncbi:MAG TPA: hypothetical protein VLH75_14290 [Longimicrobiales bacterium]|nr:hypothetical protein [Longimicrobiales bacterium]